MGLAFAGFQSDIQSMAKRPRKTRDSQSGRYEAAGKTHDGVTILMPKTKPTHFTTREIRTTITEVRRDAATGRFSEKRKAAQDRSSSRR
jgi:hypothetical protein